MLNRCRMIPTLALICCLAAHGGFASDWPQFRGVGGNAASDDAQTPVNWSGTENIAWKQNVGTGFSSVAVAAGRIYTMGHSGAKRDGEETVWCFDAATGDEIWSDTYTAPLIDPLPAGIELPLPRGGGR